MANKKMAGKGKTKYQTKANAADAKTARQIKNRASKTAAATQKSRNKLEHKKVKYEYKIANIEASARKAAAASKAAGRTAMVSAATGNAAEAAKAHASAQQSAAAMWNGILVPEENPGTSGSSNTGEYGQTGSTAGNKGAFQ